MKTNKDLLILRLTEKCNNNCIFCSDLPFRNKGGYMPLKEIQKTIDDSSDENLSLEIGGAEPTIHPDFFKILDYLNKKFKKIIIITNCRVFSYDSFVDQIKKNENISVKSSLHSNTAEIHDSITRSPGSFNQATLGFKNLIKNEIPVGVNIVINKKNINNIIEIIDLLINIGIKRFYISGMILTGDRNIDKKIMVDLNIVFKKLYKVLKYLSLKKLEFFIEKLPVCMAPDFHKNFFLESFRDHFTKLDECRNCKAKETCMGIQKEYLRQGFNFKVQPIVS